MLLPKWLETEPNIPARFLRGEPLHIPIYQTSTKGLLSVYLLSIQPVIEINSRHSTPRISAKAFGAILPSCITFQSEGLLWVYFGSTLGLLWVYFGSDLTHFSINYTI